ncbi:sugar phosphate nucleotidyltransferase [Pelagibacteraceae bacterium]|jgi:glucose-1-phosphate cytidylyltransferase|nr:sugar phosphate nucleotidyltransferase [Pelagibacteraceae bacterium]|tara:strand:- start:206 stop:886 length:681 start_codon:yes stop_codon:yes gene_type:complete
MKVVILAGGFGTRLSEYTKILPKPMVKVGGKPILLHIMNHYAKYGFDNFYIALGYKGEIIKKYFKKKKFKWKINLIETGKNTMTGGRLLKMKKYIGNETFMATYGDGISDVNLKKLVKFHKKSKKIATLTAVRPPARFGGLKLSGNSVKYFKEKSKLDESWINGGFFVLEPEIFKFIKNNNTYFEREPLENLTKRKQLAALKHDGFWQCMDTKRDKDNIDKLLRKN